MRGLRESALPRAGSPQCARRCGHTNAARSADEHLVSKRIIVVDDVDTIFRPICAMPGIEAYAFSCAAHALAAARELMPDLIVVADRERTVDVERFADDLRGCADMNDVPVLFLTPGRTSYRIAGEPTMRRIDPSALAVHMKRALGIDYAPVPTGRAAAAARALARGARHEESMTRVSMIRNVDSDRFIAAVLRESAESLRDDVAFSALLVRRDAPDWVVDASYEPDAASIAMPDPGTRAPLLRSFGDGRRTVIAAPFSVGTTTRVLLLAAAIEPRDALDGEDRTYINTLAAMCSARFRQRDGLDRLAEAMFGTRHDASLALRLQLYARSA
jgi:hypothetical protein